MPEDKNNNELDQVQQKQREAAINALQFFVSKYSPATMQDADTFFTTTEISQAIAQHTGFMLSAAEVYEVMVQMTYTFEILSGFEYNWLLKKL